MPLMKAQAIVFEAPKTLMVRSLELSPMGARDVEVAVSLSGISSGSECLLWDGTMPPLPGLAYPLVPGHETVGTVASIGPEVWETQGVHQSVGIGYAVIDPDQDPRKDYRCICDVSSDSGILNRVIPKIAPGGEVILADFYKQDLSFSCATAFMREASMRVAAQSKMHDLDAVVAMFHDGSLPLEGLITHAEIPERAQQAYEVALGDPDCLKMVIDWRAS